MKSQSGSTLVEFIFGFPIVIAMVTGMLSVCYFLISSHWLRLQLQESILCADQLNAIAECKAILVTSISTYLPIGSLEQIDFDMDSQHIDAAIRFVFYAEFAVDERQSLLRPVSLSAIAELQ